MNGFAKATIAQRNREKRENASKAPKGFDILLADAISQFDLKQSQISLLNEMTRSRRIASANVGTRVYYRRASLERLFLNEE